MRTLTAVTTESFEEISSNGPVPAVERAAYVYVGKGKFEPANDAAWREVERWNAYAEAWNAYTASRSAL